MEADVEGQIQIESKDEMRKRGLPSPDRADAPADAFAYVEAPAIDVESHQGESITGDLMQKAWWHPASQETLLQWTAWTRVRPVRSGRSRPIATAG